MVPNNVTTEQLRAELHRFIDGITLSRKARRTARKDINKMDRETLVKTINDLGPALDDVLVALRAYEKALTGFIEAIDNCR